MQSSPHSNDDLLFIYHLLPGQIPKKNTKPCLRVQDFTQSKPAGPSGAELCGRLTDVQQHPAARRGRYFQAEVGEAV